MITAIQALQLASKIEYHYAEEKFDSTAINSVIAQELGPALYEKFCAAILCQKKIEEKGTPLFKTAFLNNPVRIEDEATDLDIKNRYSFQHLMEAIVDVLAEQSGFRQKSNEAHGSVI